MVVVLLLGMCVAPTYSSFTTIQRCDRVAVECAYWMNRDCILGDYGTTSAGIRYRVVASTCTVGQVPTCGQYIIPSSTVCINSGSTTAVSLSACTSATNSNLATATCNNGESDCTPGDLDGYGHRTYTLGCNAAFATSPFFSVLVVLVSLVLVA